MNVSLCYNPLFFIGCLFFLLFACTNTQQLRKESSIIDRTSERVRPNLGRSGKPEARDVIYMVMQNYDVPLNIHESCENMGVDFEDKTIGEFLSGWWAYHDVAHPNTDPENVSYPPDSLEAVFYLDISVEEGDFQELSPKHWKVSLMLGGDTDGGNVLWNLGVSFLVLDKDWEVVRDSFKCLGN